MGFLLDSTAIARINRNYDSTSRCCQRETILLAQVSRYRIVADSLSAMVVSASNGKYKATNVNINLEAENQTLINEKKAISSQLKKMAFWGRIKDVVIVAVSVFAVVLTIN